MELDLQFIMIESFVTSVKITLRNHIKVNPPFATLLVLPRFPVAGEQAPSGEYQELRQEQLELSS